MALNPWTNPTHFAVSQPVSARVSLLVFFCFFPHDALNAKGGTGIATYVCLFICNLEIPW